MGIEEHHKAFLEVIKKYGLDEEENADKVADILTDKSRGRIAPGEFAGEFGMSTEEAMVFLSFVEKGLTFKELHMDGK